MTKSLGDYNKERSSTADFKNIRWTLKNQSGSKTRKRKNKKIPPQNIISGIKTDAGSKVKIYRITSDSKTKQRQGLDSRFQRSSANNCLIRPGFKRPGR